MPELMDIVNFISGGSGDSGQSSGGTVAAYKGDGLNGMGVFLTGMANAYRKERTHDSQTTDRLKPEIRASLDEYLNYMKFKYGIGSEYTKCDAFSDAERAVDKIFYDYKTQLPQILSRSCAAGIYNSTSVQALINDAYARATSASADLKLKAVTDYRRLEMEGDDRISNLFGRQIESWTSFDETKEFETKPDMEQFAKDAAIAAIALGILQLFTMRKYQMDDSNSGSGGGITDGLG